MRSLFLVVLLAASPACSQQRQPPDVRGRASRPDLYVCEGCEVTMERSVATLTPRLNLPPAGEPGAPLTLTGHVVQSDGRTPAPGVVLYIHQTDATGRYRSVRSTGRGGRGDGILEGWLVTDADGRYRIDTVRPAPYPDAGLPAHLHVYVREPGRQPYYIDDVVFEDDPNVTAAYRVAQELRGGSGIVRLAAAPGGGWRARRDIVLEP